MPFQESLTFVELFPPVPSYNYMFMLEAMTYKITLATVAVFRADAHNITVQAWTSQCDRNHCDGSWHAVDLEYINSEENGNGKVLHHFGHSVIITGDRDFEFTFRCKVAGDDDFVWSHGFGVNGFTHVEPPRLNDQWTLGPDFAHIVGGIHLGNFIAATNAAQLHFTHVLNVADNLDMVYGPDDHVTYHKIAMRDGAHNPIETPKIAEAVEWLRSADREPHRILVNCRAGIGRAGSTVTAYVFAMNASFSFKEAYEFVFAKRFIYPHAGLAASLYQLYPRAENMVHD